MNLFRKKPSSGSAAKNNVVEVLFDETGLKGLAFGLSWRSIVTSGGRDFAIAIARKANSTHYIFRGSQVGYGALKKGAENSVILCSAAAIAARQHAGDCVYALRVSEGVYWVAMTRNGSPTSHDKFLLNSDDAEALALVREIFVQLTSEGLEPSIYSNIEQSGIDAVKPIGVQDLFDASSSADDQFVPLPKKTNSIPKPVLYIGAALVVAMVGNSGYKTWKVKQQEKLALASQAEEIDATVIWAEARKAWESSNAAPDARGLDVVRASLAQLPAAWDGWNLSVASCTAGPYMGAAVKTWSCNGQYTRMPGGSLTREMNANIPQKWAVSFTPLNDMVLSWQATQPTAHISIDSLPKALAHQIETTSKLQKAEKTFAQAPTFAFSPVVMTLPSKKDGTPYESDPSVAKLAMAKLTIAGPLRSLDAAVNANLDVDWQSFTLNYSSVSGESSISTSVLSAQATGALYANN